MKAAASESAFALKLGRFLRWFFNASPDAVVEPALPGFSSPRAPTVSHRLPPRVLARHTGPVRVPVKGKP